MRLVPKDIIRFELPAADPAAAAVVEVLVRPDRFGWAATARLRPADDGAGPTASLPRVFRARDRALAAGKMVAWVRRRFEGARPVAERRARAGRR